MLPYGDPRVLLLTAILTFSIMPIGMSLHIDRWILLTLILLGVLYYSLTADKQESGITFSLTDPTIIGVIIGGIVVCAGVILNINWEVMDKIMIWMGVGTSSILALCYVIAYIKKE